MSKFLFFLLSIIIVLEGLGSCAAPHSAYSSLPVAMNAADPDGDGDTKGVNYFSPIRPATGNKVFIFDPSYNAWAVYNEMGVLANTGKASGGSLYCPDLGRPCKTVVGQYRVLWKGDGTCISHKYPLETNGGAPMPYCMYFNSAGYAIHGSYEIPDYNASHGCIRITPTAAHWLNEHFLTVGSKVVVLPYTTLASNSDSN